MGGMFFWIRSRILTAKSYGMSIWMLTFIVSGRPLLPLNSSILSDMTLVPFIAGPGALLVFRGASGRVEHVGFRDYLAAAFAGAALGLRAFAASAFAALRAAASAFLRS